MQSVTASRPPVTTSRPPAPSLSGWRRAYVDWRVLHAGDLDAIAEGVKREDTWQLVHALFESALKAGFERGSRGREVTG